jgi:hypothetical protein
VTPPLLLLLRRRRSASNAAAAAAAVASSSSLLARLLSSVLPLAVLLAVLPPLTELAMHSSARDLSVMDVHTCEAVADVAASRECDRRCSRRIGLLLLVAVLALLLPPPLLLALRVRPAAPSCVTAVATSTLPLLLLASTGRMCSVRLACLVVCEAETSDTCRRTTDAAQALGVSHHEARWLLASSASAA